jgi:hypothetical protein
MRRPERTYVAICIGLLLSACVADGAPASPAPTSTGSEPAREAQDESPPVEQSCPNPYGGDCLGPIAAGTYTTTVFATPVTYIVPDGWANYEDLPGNMLLVAPGSTLDDVDAGTGDYIGLGDGVAVASGSCIEQPEASIEATPEAMVTYFADHEGLDTTEPQPTEVGGLEGWVIDLGIAEGYTGTCPYASPPGAPVVPMIIGGLGPASLHHVVGQGFDTRLYLLEGQAGRVLSIEISDDPDGPPMAELDAVVQTFEFEEVTSSP